ncbi:hypothetical protein I6I10_06900 [Corynebacterium glucuronolyticum]|uniref:Uncharacterized protein n=1 Tax=Corynebacterium glucuronolyticum TaxID=39791 RepID=A0A7T4ECL2_9CORY|nr:hypothetical protein [Corynebacterium glucuronolyticum]QQB45338.1 hypothetical protein I6I10_07270 [Corynebacterium glucuronolyticum]QQB47590.1 hypothetical protein I6I10_06900 [Corynebacterium glucuronolyticum]WKD64047.1 hypothetical protein CGLUCO_09010 [Corynebacterium glucuronolyticum DSM 44120]SMB82293.1 hypothetical protein SAMN05660745_02616 [Corynebacterium glucuronolyticum]
MRRLVPLPNLAEYLETWQRVFPDAPLTIRDKVSELLDELDRAPGGDDPVTRMMYWPSDEEIVERYAAPSYGHTDSNEEVDEEEDT